MLTTQLGLMCLKVYTGCDLGNSLEGCVCKGVCLRGRLEAVLEFGPDVTPSLLSPAQGQDPK